MLHRPDDPLAVSNPAVTQQIRRAPGIRLTPVESALLRRAFAHSQSLFVEREFRSGYSGALVLLVSVDSGLAPVVVKMAAPPALQREYDAYHRFVLPSAPQNTAHLQGAPLLDPAHDLGILIYTFAGGDPRRPSSSLRDYYDAQGGEAAGALLNRIFRAYGRHWWAVNRPHKFVLGEYYDHLLPVHLELTLPAMTATPQYILADGEASTVDLRDLRAGDTVRLLGFRVVKVKRDEGSLTLSCDPPAGEASPPLRLRVLNAPLDLWRVGDQVDMLDAAVAQTRQSLLMTAAQQALNAVGLTTGGVTDTAALLQPLAELDVLLDRVVEARFSTIHGDLNLNNVLVDVATGFAWLIDFADTRHGPTLYDLQRLEVQVIIKLLPDLFAQMSALPVAAQMAALANLLDALHADPPAPLAPDAALQEPYVLLAHIRRLARQYLMDDLEWDEYYLGLMAALMGALKFDELTEPTRCLILTATATVQKWLGVPPRRSMTTTVAANSSHALAAAPRLGEIAPAAATLPALVTPPEPARPPRADNFVGRDAELTAFAEQIQAQRFAVISGMAGVGKTALAAVLTDWVAAPEKVFWHSLREGDGINTIVWKLAAFLAHHGVNDLWRLLETARQTGGQPPPTDTLIDYLLQLLRPQNYLLCFDDLHVVEEDPAFEQFLGRLRQTQTDSALMLLITTRRLPAFVAQAHAEPLRGLPLADTQRLLRAHGLALDPSLQAELQQRTDGNAQFLTLAINILQQAADPVQLLERLAETDDVERYLLSRVDEGLSGVERGHGGGGGVAGPAGQPRRH
ncbi:MAG: phosphotransferase [Caldilineaceae bacterium]